MQSLRRLIMMTMILSLFSIIVAGCGSAPVVIKRTPTPRPVPMVRITVQLVDVFCNHKQNAFGFHDQFYMMTTFAAPTSNSAAAPDTQALLSQPLDITSGQDLALPQSHLLVFDGLVPVEGSLRGGFTAYNDKQGLTWQDIDEWVSGIARSVGNKFLDESIDSGDIGTIAAAAVIALGVNAWYVLAHLSSDNSNQLGDQSLVISASGPPSQDGVLHFYNGGGWFGVNGWDYTVRYHITRTQVTA
jgi:hypothetical protein